MSLNYLEDDYKEKDLVVEHAEHPATHDANLADLQQAMSAEAQEHMPVLQALKTYPKATFWSFCVSFLIVSRILVTLATILTKLQVMEAYDNSLISNLMAQPAFQQHFGVPVGDGTYQIPPAWQSACNQAATIGAFIGILLCGYIQPKIGYKKTILGSLVFIIATIFVVFFANTLPMLFAGELLIGLPFGFYNAIAQAYASEIAPLPLRGLFTMFNQSCWCTGQFITVGILYGFRNGTSKMSYKIPFAVQWIWPIPLIAILYFAPESPWWLVRTGRYEEAQATVKRLEGRTSTRDPADVVAMMKRTIEIETKRTEGSSYAQICQGVDRRRTMSVSLRRRE